MSVKWGQISQVTATLNLLDEAHTHGEYDFYWLISGQDWPIRTTDAIVKFFEEHTAENFVQYLDSKNHGIQKQNSFDKKTKFIFHDGGLGKKYGKELSKDVI